MRAYILSIGSELILGHLTDTNATFLAQELVGLGIELLHVTQVGDDRSRIARTIQTAMAEADLVVCTGGVGPTDDDLTREAIADAIGETPVVEPALLKTIETFFATRALTMPVRNRKQAWLIPSAEPLPNPVGTAPGWFVRQDRKIVVAMPGVPREMTKMWRDQAVPRLADRLPERAVRSVTIRTIGIGESAAEQLLDDLVQTPNPSVATYAKDDGVQVRVTGVAPTAPEAEALRDQTAAEVERRLRRFVYGRDDTSLPSALLDLLRARALTIAVVDHGGGGRFTALLASEAAAAGVLLGGIAAPPDGTPAAKLAEDAATWSGARLGLGIALDLQPTSVPVLTATTTVALTGALAIEESFAMSSAFDEIQRRAGLMAADVLRRALVSSR